MRINQLNHVALHVADVPRSVLFYMETLGLRPIDRPPFDFPGAWFELGPEQELHLIGGRGAPVGEERHTHFALRVDDWRAAAAELAAKGIPMRGPKPRPDGAMQIFIRDPDGHVVELTDLSTIGGMKQ